MTPGQKARCNYGLAFLPEALSRERSEKDAFKKGNLNFTENMSKSKNDN